MGYDSLPWEPAKLVNGLQPGEELHQRYIMKPGPLGDVLGGPRTNGEDTVTVLGGTKILGINDMNIGRVSEELCHGEVETLADVDDEARCWR
jgi:hypothetical protein